MSQPRLLSVCLGWCLFSLHKDEMAVITPTEGRVTTNAVHQINEATLFRH